VRFIFGVTFGAVVPFSTAGGSDGDLGVEDVLTHFDGVLAQVVVPR